MDKKPNFLLITSDQQHHGCLGSLNPILQTPALRRLESEGVRFDRAYCNSPVCSPSRATILTGMYPAWHHCWTIGVKLPEDVPTVNDVLAAHGYARTLIGKAHFQPGRSEPDQESIETVEKMRDLDFWRDFHGPWYGFDHFEMTKVHGDQYDVGAHYAIWMEEQGLRNWRDYFLPYPDSDQKKKRHLHWDLPAEFHYSTWCAERTIASMERHVAEDRPFFLWSSFADPHFPDLVPEPWDRMYDPADVVIGRRMEGELERMAPYFKITQDPAPDFTRYPGWRESGWLTHGFHTHATTEEALRRRTANYYGKISFMDQQVGRILDAVDRLGIADSTLVVFTSDHGHFLGQHGLVHKGPFHYEDMLRVPMIARFPGKIPSKRTESSLQALIDLPETFLDAAGLPIPGVMQGKSQWEHWQGRSEAPNDHIIVENRHQPTAVHLRTYIERRFKITVYRGHPFGDLFDLEADPEEHCNLWDDPKFLELKASLLHRFMDAELRREPTRHRRIHVA